MLTGRRSTAALHCKMSYTGPIVGLGFLFSYEGPGRSSALPYASFVAA